MTRKEAIALWLERVFSQAAVIDPNDSGDWESLALGFFLGLGLPIKQARLLVEKCYMEDLL
jgi:hypothetical protein